MDLSQKFHRDYNSRQCKTSPHSKDICSACYVGRSGEDRLIKLHFGNIHLYGVFDGHGGTAVVDRVMKKLPTRLLAELNKSNLKKENLVKEIIQKVYQDVDLEIFREIQGDISGSTATIAIVIPGKIYFINLGDSRTVLYTTTGEVLFETKDHSPEDLLEKSRIEAIGGNVLKKDIYRVEGILAVTRAFGDYQLKRSHNSSIYNPMGWVSVIPDVYTYELDNNPKLHLLLASDGLWDGFSTDNAVAVALNSFYPCMQLIQEGKKKTTDDITVVIVNV
jgi:protein phosphatase 1L